MKPLKYIHSNLSDSDKRELIRKLIKIKDSGKVVLSSGEKINVRQLG